MGCKPKWNRAIPEGLGCLWKHFPIFRPAWELPAKLQDNKKSEIKWKKTHREAGKAGGKILEISTCITRADSVAFKNHHWWCKIFSGRIFGKMEKPDKSPGFDRDPVACSSFGLKGGSEPLEKAIHEILGSKREERFSAPFLIWYKIPVWFLVRTCLASAISVRPRGTCKSSCRSATR